MSRDDGSDPPPGPIRVRDHVGATPGDAEFTFELLVSRWAELAWPPEGAGESAVVVARQLGTSDRRWDTVVVECDPDGLAARLALDERGLDSDLVHVVRNAPATWTYYREALPDPGYPWSYVRAAVHRGADRGLIETRKRGGRVELRRLRPYPEWVRRVVAVENKPDLDAAAARSLSDQLAHDVDAAAGLDADAATVEWHAGDLDAPDPHAAPSVKAGKGDDREAVTERDRLAARRLELAERAFDRGWRSFVDTMRPDCRAFELRRHGRALVPYCTAKSCHQTAGECAGSCESFGPEPPQWRTRSWPIDGGPGRGVQALLDRRRERARRRGGDETAASEDRSGDLAGSDTGAAGRDD